MAKVVFTLDDPVAEDRSLAGAKGATLAQMTRAGLPVPPGFIVSTEAHQAVAGTISAQVFKDLKPSDPDELQCASDKVRQIILDASLSSAHVSQIQEAYASLGEIAVSVRSSSTAEDLDQASFAGQYDSFLNVGSIDSLIDCLQKVWASLYSLHAVGYRQKNGISHDQVRMAVVIQEQLDPHAAGVLFTRDPLSGDDHYVVSAALGLGEGVVAGTAQTDRFVLQPDTGKLLSSEVVSKKTRVVPVETGGIGTVSVDASESDIPALTESQLMDLAALGRRLVDLLGGRQDIEFAATGNTLQILQSRPMTAFETAVEPDEAWDGSLDSSYHWSRSRGPFCRLEEEFATERLDQMRVCYEETGSSMASNHVPHLANGYLFVRARKLDEDVLEKLHARQTERVDACLKEGKSYFEGVLRGIVEERLARLKQMRVTVSDFPGLVAYLEASIKTCGYVQGNLHWRQGKPGKRVDWPTEYHEVTGEPAQDAHIFTQAVQNRMTRLIARLRELARRVQEDPDLSEIFAERRFDALTSPGVKERSHVKRFHSRFKAMLRIYGLRGGHGYGSNADFTTPTWNMKNSIPLEIIASYAEQDLGRLDVREHRARSERINATRRMRRKLAKEPERLERFNHSLKMAIIWVRFLEDHNYSMEQSTVGTMREAIFEVGKALVWKDLIDVEDDVIHVSLAELKEIARDKNPGDLRTLVRKRSEELDRRRRMKPPQTLGAEPEASRSESEDEKDVGLKGSTIKGVSASGGRVTGRAVIALPGRARPHLHPGDILIAPNVGPDWTPAFGILGGLVLDSGSLSQHAAVVAREYRIPAVMQTEDASSTITEGQIIVVDGDNGIVELTF